MKRTLIGILVLCAIAAVLVVLFGKSSTTDESTVDSNPTIERETKQTPPLPVSDPEQKTGIHGSVINKQNGFGIEGAIVTLYRVAKPGDTVEKPPTKIPAWEFKTTQHRTGRNGRFSLPIPTPAQYFLRAEQKGFGTADSDPFTIEKDSREIPVNVSLPAESTLELTVSYQEKPYGGAKILLLRKTKPPIEKEADHKGKVLFAGLSAGEYWLRIEPTGGDSNPHYWDAMQNAPKDSPDIVLQEGEQKKLDFPLEGGKPGKCAGFVAVNSNAPTQEMRLVFTLLKKPKYAPTAAMSSITAKTDSKGHFAVDKLLPGPYKVVLYPTALPTASPIEEQQLEIAPGVESLLNFSLRLGSIRGRVVDANGQGLRQARVVLKEITERKHPTAEGCWADTEGRFQTQMIPAGKYEMTVFASSQPTKTMTVQVESSGQDIGEVSLGK